MSRPSTVAQVLSEAVAGDDDEPPQAAAEQAAASASAANGRRTWGRGEILGLSIWVKGSLTRPACSAAGESDMIAPKPAGAGVVKFVLTFLIFVIAHPLWMASARA